VDEAFARCDAFLVEVMLAIEHRDRLVPAPIPHRTSETTDRKDSTFRQLRHAVKSGLLRPESSTAAGVYLWGCGVIARKGQTMQSHGLGSHTGDAALHRRC